MVEFKIEVDDVGKSGEILDYLHTLPFDSKIDLKNDHKLISKKENPLGYDIRLKIHRTTPRVRTGFIKPNYTTINFEIEEDVGIYSFNESVTHSISTLNPPLIISNCRKNLDSQPLKVHPKVAKNDNSSTTDLIKHTNCN